MNLDLRRQIRWKWLAATWLGLVVCLVLVAGAAGDINAGFFSSLQRETLIGLLPWAAWRAWEAHHDPDGRGWRRWDLAVIAGGMLVAWVVPLAALAVGVYRHVRGTSGGPTRGKAKRGEVAPHAGVRAIALGEYRRRPYYARSHVLLVGPTGCGKTWTGMIPAISQWDAIGPVLAISTKNDLAGPLAAIRARTQPVFGWDPSGTGIFNGIPGLEPVSFDLVGEISSPDDAVFLGDQVIRSVSMASVDGGDYWSTQGGMLLAALLWAARCGGHDMAWVLDQSFAGADVWVTTLKIPGMEQAENLATSLWSLVDAAHGQGQRRVDSVAGTVQSALASYRLQSLRTTWARPLTMTEWATRGGCLFVASPADQSKTLAPIIVGQVAAAIAAQRRVQHPGVLVAIDEIANVCPLPDLGTWLTELRSWGVTLLGAQQAWSQMTRWGAEQSVIEHSWPTLVLFPGVSDHKLLDEISTASGEIAGAHGKERMIGHADVVGGLRPGQVRIVNGRTPQREVPTLSPVRELEG